jgi:predicted membrane channel-forming protein YqfA (hemolysin III family)
MPTRLLVAAALTVAFAVVIRKPLRAALGETWRAVRGWAREAGPWHMLGLAAIAVIGVLLRRDFLHEPMRWDESYTFLAYVSHPLNTGLALYETPNNHLFNTFLMHFSWKGLGMGEGALRAPVFIAGSLIPVALYVAVVQIYGRHAALAAAALAAASAQLTEYATNARGYSIAAFFAVCLLALAPRIQRSANPTWIGMWVVVTALGFYTVPVFAYPCAVVAAAVVAGALLEHRDRRALGPIARVVGASAAGTALAAFLYGPILGDVIDYMRQGEAYSSEPWDLLNRIWHLWTLGIPEVATWVLLLAFAVGALALGRLTSMSLPVGAVAVVFVIFLVVAGRMVNLTRVFLPLLPIFLAVAAGGAVGLKPVKKLFERRAADLAFTAAAVAGALLLALKVAAPSGAGGTRLGNVESSPVPDADRIAQAVGPKLGPDDQILLETSSPVLAFAFERNGFSRDSVVDKRTTHGRAYVVVNALASETLAQTVSLMAPGADPATAHKVGQFDGATVYALPPR